jgi:hypothetical protein
VGSNATAKPNRCIDEEHPHTRVSVPCGGPAAVGGKPVCTASLTGAHARPTAAGGEILSERSSKIRHFLTGACCTVPAPSTALRITRRKLTTPTPRPIHHACGNAMHRFRHTRAPTPAHPRERTCAAGRATARAGGVGADSEGGVRVHGRRTSCSVLLSISVKLGRTPSTAQMMAAYADQLMAPGRGPVPLVIPR